MGCCWGEAILLIESRGVTLGLGEQGCGPTVYGGDLCPEGMIGELQMFADWGTGTGEPLSWQDHVKEMGSGQQSGWEGVGTAEGFSPQ